MAVFTVTFTMQNYTQTSKQSDKHILIIVKCLQLSTNNIGSATEIVYSREEEDTLEDCGEGKVYLIFCR